MAGRLGIVDLTRMIKQNIDNKRVVELGQTLNRYRIFDIVISAIYYISALLMTIFIFVFRHYEAMLDITLRDNFSEAQLQEADLIYPIAVAIVLISLVFFIVTLVMGYIYLAWFQYTFYVRMQRIYSEYTKYGQAIENSRYDKLIRHYTYYFKLRYLRALGPFVFVDLFVFIKMNLEYKKYGYTTHEVIRVIVDYKKGNKNEESQDQNFESTTEQTASTSEFGTQRRNNNQKSKASKNRSDFGKLTKNTDK